ncbi:MAG TPA: hypothetical protein VLO11_02150 [Luteolibacter sp.]|nr:hypothetical protein [Luteolibacter sp.]
MLRWAAILALAAGSVSCMTTYDSAGRPVQSVDPGLAVAGVAAAGLIGYALADDNDHHRHYRGGHNRYYRGHYRHSRHGYRY